MQHRRCGEFQMCTRLIVALVVMFASAPFCRPSKQKVQETDRAVSPSITITRVPPKGGGPDVVETIAGVVKGVKIRECRVVVFAHTNTWYVQPFVASPYTSIGNDGKWETKTHLGDEYAALLVEPSYKPPPTMDALPEVIAPILAIAKAPASNKNERKTGTPGSVGDKPKVKIIQFSGYQWKVKSSGGRVGPGPNYFSASSNNVAVDAKGRLHLRLTKRDGRWYCAEVVSDRSFGYGTYRFYIDTRVDDIDPRIVLGMFTWSDDPAFSHREIDVEISRWGDLNNKNGQFVEQPYTHPMNIVRFQIPLGLNSTTHLFRWQPDSVFCESLKGMYADLPQAGSIIQQHTFTQDVPQAGDENARINLWLMTGEPPTDRKEAEIVISKFEFVPSK